MDVYVVRIWRPGRGGESERLRGTAVHLATGKDMTFTDPQTLIRFLTAGAAEDTTSTAAESSAGDQLRDNTDKRTTGGQEWFE